MRPLPLALALVAVWPTPGPAQVTLFFDDFNGPTLNQVFQPSLPNGAPLGDGTDPCTYLGAPNYSFGTVGGASVIRLTNFLNDQQRVGWSTSTAFTVTNFRYEVRFNTLVQSPSTSIDSFIETWLLDATDQSRYDLSEPHGMNYSASRQFRAGSSIDNLFHSQSFDYQDNTWYRLVIQGTAGQDIRASVYADDGLTELIGQTFAHTADAYPGGFRLGVAQSMGSPGSQYLTDVAIDWMGLTTISVPEPSALALAGVALAGGAAFARKSRRRPPVGRR